MDIPAHRQVAIVCFEADRKNAETAIAIRDGMNQAIPVPRVVLYQVTIDPSRISPTGSHIRFGVGNDDKGRGDEITGWQRVDDLEIVEVLAIEDEHGELIAGAPAVHSTQIAA
jgi:hypothetical protein